MKQRRPNSKGQGKKHHKRRRSRNLKSKTPSFSPSLSGYDGGDRPVELDLSTSKRTFLAVNVILQTNGEVSMQEQELILRGLFSWAKREARWLQPRDLFVLSSKRTSNSGKKRKMKDKEIALNVRVKLFIATTNEGAIALETHLKPSAKLNKCISTHETKVRVKNSEVVTAIDPSCQSLLQLSWKVAQAKKMGIFRHEMSELANRSKNPQLGILCELLNRTESINVTEGGFNITTRCISGARMRFSFLDKPRSSCLTCEKSTKYEFWWSYLPSWCSGSRSLLTNDIISLIVSFVMKPPLPEPPLENWFKQPEKLCELQQPKKKKTMQLKVYRMGILTNKSRFAIDLEKRDVEDLFWSFDNVFETLSRL